MKDWDKELAKIDRMLEKQGIDTKSTEKAAAGSPPARSAETSKAGTPAKPSPRRPMSLGLGPVAVWIRSILGVAVAASLTQWPYAYECGTGLFAYLGAAGFVSGVGVWGAMASWRQRTVLAHVVSVAVVFTGLAVVGLTILPRLGYAGQSVVWLCP